MSRKRSSDYVCPATSEDAPRRAAPSERASERFIYHAAAAICIAGSKPHVAAALLSLFVSLCASSSFLWVSLVLFLLPRPHPLLLPRPLRLARLPFIGTVYRSVLLRRVHSRARTYVHPFICLTYHSSSGEDHSHLYSDILGFNRTRTRAPFTAKSARVPFLLIGGLSVLPAMRPECRQIGVYEDDRQVVIVEDFLSRFFVVPLCTIPRPSKCLVFSCKILNSSFVFRDIVIGRIL